MYITAPAVKALRESLREKPFYLNEEELSWVCDTLASMSPEEKAGQIFCALGDAESTEGLVELVRDYHLGSVLFRPAPLAEVREKYAALRAYARIPLLNAANLEEGGAGVLSDGIFFGCNLGVAAANDQSCVEAFAKNCAAEGRAAGVSWSFSPVVDINLNYQNPITNVRTFGSDPERVLECARSYVRTLQHYGVAAAAKHFPGDGVDHRDQHLHPTYNSLSAEAWFSSYGRIYKTLIDEGLMSVMVGHIGAPEVVRSINPDAGERAWLPASQSAELLSGVLRKRFGFGGLIITDATIMGGYTMAQPRRDAIPASITAGCDMLCFGTDIREDMGYILEAVADGRLSELRLDEAVMRVLALKAAMGREYPVCEIDSAAEARRCADKSVTLIKDTQELIPVSPERYPTVRLVSLGKDEGFEGSVTEITADCLREHGFTVEIYDPFTDDLHGTRELSRDRLTVMICHMPAESNQTTVRIRWCEKHALEIPRFVNEEPTVFISLANPYHLEDVPRVKTYINAYGPTRAIIAAAIDKLTGTGDFLGVSPVDAFCGLADTRL